MPALDAEFFPLAALGEKYRKADIVLYRQKKQQDLIKSKDMKKTLIAFAITMLGLSASSNAATLKSEVPPTVEAQFNQQFNHAMDVRWEEGQNFFKATFEDLGRTLFAFYAGDGDLMGVAANLSPNALPEHLKTAIKQSYAGYWITDLFGYHNQDEQGFVVTLENADRVIVLKADGDNGWKVYRTTIKN
jgi:hypothetical protein